MDKENISLIFSNDRDLKWVIMGFVIGIIGFFGGGLSLAIMLLMIMFLLGTLFKPEIGIVLLPLFVLLDFFIKTYTNGLFGIWDDLLFLLLLVAILIRRCNQKKHFLRFTSILYPVFLFFLAGLLSTVLSPYVTFMQGIEGIRSVLQPFIVFFILINSEINRETARFLLFLSLLVAVGAGLFGLYQYIVGVASPPTWVDKDMEYGLSRAFSILGSPNAFAAYCVLFAPISLGFLMQPKLNKTQKTIFFFCFLFLLIGILTTLTRAAWLAFIPALFLFGILAKQTKLVMPLLIILVASIFIVAPIRQRFTNFFTEKYQEKSEGGGRAYRWSLAMDIFEDRPILGRGPGSFGGAVAYRAQAFKGLYVDSYYLEILSNYGIVGILLFLWILLECFRNLIFYASKSKNPRDQILVYGILCGLFGFLLHNLTENIWEIIPLAVQFWFLMGCAIQILKTEE
jgi:O-antigen ligase